MPLSFILLPMNLDTGKRTVEKEYRTYIIRCFQFGFKIGVFRPSMCQKLQVDRA